ncbi:hypothetical protein D3C84_843800 [compost metagenome]
MVCILVEGDDVLPRQGQSPFLRPIALCHGLNKVPGQAFSLFLQCVKILLCTAHNHVPVDRPSRPGTFKLLRLRTAQQRAGFPESQSQPE